MACNSDTIYQQGDGWQCRACRRDFKTSKEAIEHTAIKEHGMLYKAAMVQAIMRTVDPKTQTRRPITFTNSTTGGVVKRKEWHLLNWDNAESWTVEIPVVVDGDPNYCTMRLPAWRVPFKGGLVTVYPRIWPGHRIWAREKWGLAHSIDGNCILYPADMDRRYIELDIIPPDKRDKYEGDFTQWATDMEDGIEGRYRSSMLMPRWASRIDLNVTGMRSERIQEISAMDAIAEGIERSQASIVEVRVANEVGAFQTLWDSINAERGFGWDSNHPVWVHEFKRMVITK